MKTLQLLALVCAAAVVFVASNAHAHDFTKCKKVEDRLGISSVVMLPDPPQAGKSLRVTVGGTSSTDLNGGNVKVEIKLYGVTVATETRAVCDVLACPVVAGKEYSAVLEQEIPAETPDHLTATVRVSVTDSAGAPVSCLEALVTISNKAVHRPPRDSPYLGILENEIKFLFDKWRAQFGKRRATRLSVFRDNLVRIAKHNFDKSNTYTMALNEFADMTSEEFARERLSGMRMAGVPTLRVHHSEHTGEGELVTLPEEVALSDPPHSIDWTTRGAVTPVKNQGACGSCWAFSAVGAMESAFFIKTGQLVEFSEQELVSCDGDGIHGGVDFGCQGGLMQNAFEWVRTSDANGLCTAEDYPYESGMTSARGQCRMSECTPVPGSKLSGFVEIPASESALLAHIAEYGPVAVAIEADQVAFQFYHSGVLTGQCGTSLNHGVLAVGYGVDEATGTQFWKVKNSWGGAWGEEGYVRIQRGKRWPRGGQCGIALKASRPVF